MSVLSEAGLSLQTSQTAATSNLLTSGRITTDSRSVEKGDIFIAYKGVRQDSHTYIKEILPKSPGLIIYDNPAFAPADDLYNHLLVRNSREAWAWICAAASDNPQKTLKFLGVTGTNGKTSICWILQKLMEHEGLTTLNIGTLGFLLDGKHFLPNKHTTPDPPEFYQALNAARHQGARWVVMECSSHSLSQKKLAPVLFEACGWSSFSRDHETMDAYFEAKWQLFTRHLKPNGRAILSKSLSPKPDTASEKWLDLRVGVTWMRPPDLAFPNRSQAVPQVSSRERSHAVQEFPRGHAEGELVGRHADRPPG